MKSRHIPITLLCAGLLIAAQAAEHLSDHEEFCLQQPATPCAILLQQALEQTQLQTLQWFKLQSYRLDYMYVNHQFRQLYDESNQLLKINDAPQAFRTQLYFYQAKVAISRGDEAQTAYYTELASRQLDAIYQAFADPMRVLELANLQAVAGHYDKAWQLLLQAEQRFSKILNPAFIFELNSNKALIRHAFQQLDDAAYYRKLALDAILPSQRHHDIIVAHGNLARTYQLQGQLGLAVDYYEKSLPYMRPGIDDLQQSIHWLRLSELYLALQAPAKARGYLQQVNSSLLSDGHQALLRQVSAALHASG
jgi:tetratricopeptide (TPR) repeat protein